MACAIVCFTSRAYKPLVIGNRTGGSAIDLPKHPVVHGHPLHAILSDGPAVLIPVAFAVEVWRRMRNDTVAEQLSRVATRTATAAAAAAGVVGWIDWLTIPGEHPARTPATVHGLINTAGLVALIGASAAPKRRFGLLAAATGGLLVAAWIGGDLVFRFGWRVRPAEEAEIVEQQLAEAGQPEVFQRARQEVADFERRKTFLPAP
jgi:uncharacterized membrane protein